jgi:hypothetical protein
MAGPTRLEFATSGVTVECSFLRFLAQQRRRRARKHHEEVTPQTSRRTRTHLRK